MNLRETDKKCQEIQKIVYGEGKEVNTFYKNENCSKQIIDGFTVLKNILYSSEFPNNILDIWLSSENHAIKRPAIIYFHGGGFIFGSKTGGDPLSSGGKKTMAMIQKLVDQGYHVVSVNYALAPEYRFPVQVNQVNEVFDFIQKKSNEFGIDTNQLFLMGSSAGANLTAIYGLVATNPQYAKKLEIIPSIEATQLKGLIVDESLLNIAFMNEEAKTLMQTFLGDDDLENSNNSKLINVGRWIDKNYPPTFVISSNVERQFYDCAKDLLSDLVENSIFYDSFYIDQSVDKLEHGFMMRFETNIYAKECVDKVLAFINKRVQK